MPLNTRKSLKAAQVNIDKSMQQISKAYGKEVTFIDNYQEIFNKLKTGGRAIDYLFNLGDDLKEYAKQLEKILAEFFKNSDNKEQLETELTTGKIGIKFLDEPPSNWWTMEDGTLFMETSTNYYGSNYLSYYSVDRLCRILGKNDSMPLNTRKSLKAADVKIKKHMQDASKLYGKELQFVDNFQEIYDKLKAAGRNTDYLFNFGDDLSEYARQCVTCFTQFCKDKDNVEALEEVLTSGKIGVRFGGDDEYWVIDDGVLWMTATNNRFGTSYLSYYNSDRLEKKL